VYKFQFIELLLALNCRLMGGAMLRIARERIATPVCALARNDILVGFHCFAKQENH